MITKVLEFLRKIWMAWGIRGNIVISLSVQSFLTLMAPFRKCTKARPLILLIWCAYLMAHTAASYAITVIARSINDGKQNNGVLVFWAAFLLHHLGCPDTITAFSVEDNYLWRRNLLSLILNAGGTIYAFLQSLPHNELKVPALLISISGVIKYCERIYAMYVASFDRLWDWQPMRKKPDPGPDYAKIMNTYVQAKGAKLPVRFSMQNSQVERPSHVKMGPLNQLEVVYYAHHYFNMFKGLVVDINFTSPHECDEIRHFFFQRGAEDALRLLEVELNFIHGILYTKDNIIHTTAGYIFRIVAFGSILASLGLFYFKEKPSISQVDIQITYFLLIGAIILEIIAFLMLIFSDRNRIIVSIKDPSRPVNAVLKGFLALRDPWWHNCDCKLKKHEVLATPLMLRRWSGSVSAHNLIRFCLESNRTTIHKFPSLFDIIFDFLGNSFNKVLTMIGIKIKSKFGGCNCMTMIRSKFGCCTCIITKIKRIFVSPVITKIKGFIIDFDFVKEIMYVSREPFTKELWKFIFEELKGKSEFADTPEMSRRISSSRGEYVLTDTQYSFSDRDKLLKYVSAAQVEYDESLLLWHIATDLCYNNDAEQDCSHRQFSKILSDYMLYLLLFQPSMISTVVGIGAFRFDETCAEAIRFFHSRNIKPNQDKEACNAILSVNTDVEPVNVKGDKSKSVLFKASILAKGLIGMQHEGDKKWELISRVWVELLSYAATHSKPVAHAHHLSKGGELITFVWLLTVHLGLGQHF